MRAGRGHVTADVTHLVEAVDAHFTVDAPGVVLTLLAHSATDLPAGLTTHNVKLSSSASTTTRPPPGHHQATTRPLTAKTLESYLHFWLWLLQLHFLHSFFIFPVAGRQGTSW